MNHTLHNLPCHFIYSTWHSNDFRCNYAIREYLTRAHYHILTREHFYHVGASEELRNSVLEAIVTTCPPPGPVAPPPHAIEPQLAMQF